MATLDQRVDALERQAQEDRHLLRAEMAGLSLGLSLLRNDTQALQGEVAELRTEVRAGFARVGGELNALESDMTEVKTTLAEVLRRLPEPPA